MVFKRYGIESCFAANGGSYETLTLGQQRTSSASQDHPDKRSDEYAAAQREQPVGRDGREGVV